MFLRFRNGCPWSISSRYRCPSHSYWIIANHCGSRCRQDWNKSIKMDSKRLKMVQNWLEELLKSRLWGSWGGGGGGPPKIIDFHRKLAALEARFWGPFWNPFRFMMPSRVALDGKLTILGGLVAESFFKEILFHLWRGPGQWKQWFCMGGVAKITISPKLEFNHFLTPFGRSFCNQNLSKMALGLAMGRPEWPSGLILGGPKTDP